jgi:hypothetical protein
MLPGSFKIFKAGSRFKYEYLTMCECGNPNCSSETHFSVDSFSSEEIEELERAMID